MHQLVSPLVEAPEKKEERFVNEATGTTDAVENSVANHPIGQGKVLVREEVEKQADQAMSQQHQCEEVQRMRLATEQH